MTPSEIESLVYRMAGKENLRGPKAGMRKLRFGLHNFGDPEIFDCDDRAEIARKIAVANGYEAKTAIQVSKKGRQAHRYLIVTDSKGKKYDILKKAEGY